MKTSAVHRTWGRRHPAHRRQGVVLVELAFVLPLLVLLVLATVEFAQALAAYKVVATQVRGAARYLTTQAPGAGHAQAICLVTHGTPLANCSGTPVLPGFGGSGQSAATVTVRDGANDPAGHRAQTSGAPGSGNVIAVNLVTVTVTGYQHPLMFGGFLASMAGVTGAITFSPIRVTMRQL